MEIEPKYLIIWSLLYMKMQN